MVTKRFARGGRTQHYYVRPVRYTLSGGGDDPERWGARVAGFVYVITGAALLAANLLPLLGDLGRLILAPFFPVWGVVGVVTVAPRLSEAWMIVAIGIALLVSGIGVLKDSRPAYWGAGALAIGVFAPAFWGGTLVGAFLLVSLWRGYKVVPAAA